MPTNFPLGIDSLTNPSSGSALTSPSHAGQHADANDAIEAIETYLLQQLELDYAQFTSPVSPTATTEATANTIVTGAAKTYSGTLIVVLEFFAPRVRPDDSSNAQMVFSLWDGSTDTGQIAYVGNPPSATSPQHSVYGKRRFTPSAATHTYSIRAHVSAGTGYVGAGAGGAGVLVPGFMRITRI